MRLLIVGGSVFLGRALVAEAKVRGHEITLFNRGVSSPASEPGVTLIKGDRNNELSALDGRSWDAVVDTCGYFPRQVRSLLAALSGRIGHYTFVSTVSAYADPSRAGLTETDELAQLADAGTETVTPQTYGPLKALCEKAAQQGMPEANLIVRPGIIAGPGDPSDRFSYWVGRIAAGGEVLAAGKPEAPVQLIDVRDLAAWVIGLAEVKQTGIFNAVGPAEPLTMRQLFENCAETLIPMARLVWVEDGFLVAQGMTEWMKLPLYIPEAETCFAGMFRINGTKALAQGLKLRPLARTAADAWQWIQSRPGGTAMKTGLSREQEEKLLGAWNARVR
jgi:2'-hydroxyisoflavone reductase